MTINEFIELTQKTISEEDRKTIHIKWQGLNYLYDIEPRLRNSTSGKVLLVNP